MDQILTGMDVTAARSIFPIGRMYFTQAFIDSGVSDACEVQACDL